MAYGLNMDGVRNVPDHTAAALIYDSIKPVRGTNNVRPLGPRRKKHFCIEKDGDVYHAKFYNTRCVSYYPDGLVELHCGRYDSISTVAFIHAVSPFAAFSNKGVWVRVGAYDKHFKVPCNHKLQCKRDADDKWQVLNPVQQFVKKYNPATTKRIRAHLKPLTDWVGITFKLLRNESGEIVIPVTPMPEEITRRGVITDHVQYPRIPADPSVFFEALRLCTGRGFWNSSTSSRANYYTLSATRTALHNFAYSNAVDLKLCTEDELYVTEPVPLGKTFKQKFFR